jgi:hypothetical protein
MLEEIFFPKGLIIFLQEKECVLANKLFIKKPVKSVPIDNFSK